MSEHWDKYWRSGSLTSLGSEYSQNYQGAYLAHWHSIFDALPAGARVLDIATGNGAIPLLFLQAMAQQHKALELLATDLSSVVNKAAIQGLVTNPALPWDSLSVFSGVNNTELPFDNAEIDVITSQYGFEYSPRKPTLDEICRVLKPAGKVYLVCHSTDSTIIQTNKSELRCLQQLLAPKGALAVFTELVKVLGPITSNKDIQQHKQPQRLERLRNQLNSAMASLADEFAQTFMDTGLVDLVGQLLQQRLSLAVKEKLRLVAQFRQELEQHKARLADLIQASMSQEDVNETVDYFASKGIITQRCEPLKEHDRVLGWALAFEKHPKNPSN